MTDERAGWQLGYDLPRLKGLAAVFRAADQGHALGAFSHFKERDVATALAAGTLTSWSVNGTPVAAIVARRVNQRGSIRDFTGEVRARMAPGDLQVSRIGFAPGHEEQARSLLTDRLSGLADGAAAWVHVWQESAAMRSILDGLGAELAGVKIPASSELIGVYGIIRPGRDVGGSTLAPADRLGLQRLALTVPSETLTDAVNALDRLPDVAGWGDHYSTYNRRHSWSAIALRGFTNDPEFIIKPVEMSKAWKAEHPELLTAEVRDTAARAALPELEQLVSLVPGVHQRIRLMRLTPGGGELTRHADIVDPEAGTGPSRLLRIHLPLVTNADVTFSSWSLTGERHSRNMAVGEAWYLDTRKPHTAVNGGETERVHLVIDAYSSPDLLAMLHD